MSLTIQCIIDALGRAPAQDTSAAIDRETMRTLLGCMEDSSFCTNFNILGDAINSPDKKWRDLEGTIARNKAELLENRFITPAMMELFFIFAKTDAYFQYRAEKRKNCNDRTGQSGRIYQAVLWHRADLLESILCNETVDKDMWIYGGPGIVIAAREGALECVEIFRKHGADINKPGNRDRTALHEAAARVALIPDCLEVAQHLLEVGATVTLDEDEQSPFEAVSPGDLRLLLLNTTEKKFLAETTQMLADLKVWHEQGCPDWAIFAAAAAVFQQVERH
jgi:hypothetical protein